MASNGYSVAALLFTLLLLVVVVGLLLTGGEVGWMTYLTTQVDNRDDDISSLKKDVSSIQSNILVLNALVLEQQDFIDHLIADQPTIFRRAVSSTGLAFQVNDTFRVLPNNAMGTLTDLNIGEVYNGTTFCVIGTGIQVGDNIIIKAEVSGTPSAIMSVSGELVFCDDQGNVTDQFPHGEVQFQSGSIQTYADDFSFTFTQEMLNHGGVTLVMRNTLAGQTFLVDIINYLIIRHRSLADIISS